MIHGVAAGLDETHQRGRLARLLRDLEVARRQPLNQGRNIDVAEALIVRAGLWKPHGPAWPRLDLEGQVGDSAPDEHRFQKRPVRQQHEQPTAQQQDPGSRAPDLCFSRQVGTPNAHTRHTVFISKRVALVYPTARIPVAPLEDEKSVSNATEKRAAFPPRGSLAVSLPKAINRRVRRPTQHELTAPRQKSCELLLMRSQIRTITARAGKPPGSALDRVRNPGETVNVEALDGGPIGRDGGEASTQWLLPRRNGQLGRRPRNPKDLQAARPLRSGGSRALAQENVSGTFARDVLGAFIAQSTAYQCRSRDARRNRARQVG